MSDIVHSLWRPLARQPSRDQALVTYFGLHALDLTHIKSDLGILSNGYKHYKEIFWFEFLQHDHRLEKDWIALSKNNRTSRILLFCCHSIDCHFSTVEFFPHHSNLEVSSLRFIFKNKFQTFSQSLFSILKVIFIDILFLFQKEKIFFFQLK